MENKTLNPGEVLKKICLVNYTFNIVILGFALTTTVHEQAQSNRACNILQFCCLGLSLGVLFFLYFYLLLTSNTSWFTGKGKSTKSWLWTSVTCYCLNNC